MKLTRRRLMEMAGLKEEQRVIKKRKYKRGLNEGIEVVDDEGEVIQPLSDVQTSAELEARLEKESEDYQDAWAEIPHFGVVIGDNPEDDDYLFKGLRKLPTKTYAEWIKDMKKWADSF